MKHPLKNIKESYNKEEKQGEGEVITFNQLKK